MVERLLAKEKVAGSIPVSRSEQEKVIPKGYCLFLVSSPGLGSKGSFSAPLRLAQSLCFYILYPVVIMLTSGCRQVDTDLQTDKK